MATDTEGLENLLMMRLHVRLNMPQVEAREVAKITLEEMRMHGLLADDAARRGNYVSKQMADLLEEASTALINDDPDFDSAHWAFEVRDLIRDIRNKKET